VVEVAVVVVVPESTLDRREANTRRVHKSPKGLEMLSSRSASSRLIPASSSRCMRSRRKGIGWKPSVMQKQICKGFPCDLHSKNLAEGDSGR
jgi:hypothetical protein